MTRRSDLGRGIRTGSSSGDHGRDDDLPLLGRLSGPPRVPSRGTCAPWGPEVHTVPILVVPRGCGASRDDTVRARDPPSLPPWVPWSDSPNSSRSPEMSESSHSRPPETRSGNHNSLGCALQSTSPSHSGSLSTSPTVLRDLGPPRPRAAPVREVPCQSRTTFYLGPVGLDPGSRSTEDSSGPGRGAGVGPEDLVGGESEPGVGLAPENEGFSRDYPGPLPSRLRGIGLGTVH